MAKSTENSEIVESIDLTRIKEDSEFSEKRILYIEELANLCIARLKDEIWRVYKAWPSKVAELGEHVSLKESKKQLEKACAVYRYTCISVRVVSAAQALTLVVQVVPNVRVQFTVADKAMKTTPMVRRPQPE